MFAILSRLLGRIALLGAAPMLLAGCAPAWVSPLERNHPLAGRILDARTNAYISRAELERRAAATHWVILGETHDNADHHRLQAEVFASLLRAGRRPALAMEQFDLEHQAALDAARARDERDAERIADAGKFDRKGWRWPDYKPLVELAAANGLPILAANFSREDARALMRSGRPAEGVPPAPGGLQAALEQDIVTGHCGIRPPPAMLSGMTEAQRARDAQMAAALGRSGSTGAVLIAGTGHARRDRGVTAYLPAPLGDKALVIAFAEVEAGRFEPGPGYAGVFDLVWFTPRAERADPCKDFRLR